MVAVKQAFLSIAPYVPGKPDVKIDVDQVRGKHSKAMYLALNDIKASHDFSVQYPPKMLPDIDPETGKQKIDEADKPLDRPESEAEWQIRVMGELLKQYVKEDGEDDTAYLDRVKKLNLTEHFSTVAYEFYSKVCEIMGLPVLTPEEFDEIPVERQRIFCYDILAIARIKDPEGLFFPRQTTAELARR